jgi:hypothetical protein
VRIIVEDSEHVVPHGARETTWFVRVRDAWVAAHATTGAVCERLEAGPGTVWRQRIELDLPVGTRLMRVESAPNLQRKTPLQYLAGGPASARKVLRREFQVTTKGELVHFEATRLPPPTPKKLGK